MALRTNRPSESADGRTAPTPRAVGLEGGCPVSLHELVANLQASGIRLTVKGDGIQCLGPKGAVTPEVLQLVKKHKEGLLSLQREGALEAPGPIPARSRTEPLPLWFAQERLWFLRQLRPEDTAYNIAGFMTIDAPLCADTLRLSLRDLTRRHETLRTGFRLRDGAPAQFVLSSAEPALEEIDLRAASAQDVEAAIRGQVRSQTRRAFELSEPPLLRAALLRLPLERSAFVMTAHHIVCDGWSLGILFRELGVIYRARLTGAEPALPELPIQYADFASYQRDLLSGPALERRLAYWRGQLRDCPQLLDIPTDRPRGEDRMRGAGTVRFSLPAEVSSKLKSLAREANATPYMAGLSAFVALLFRYSRQNDIVVGSPVAVRDRPELENVVGMLVNTILLRTKLTDETTARQLLAGVRETVLQAHAHADTPFEKIVQDLRPGRDLAYSPLFQAAFVYQNTPASSEFETASGGSMFDLSLFMWEHDGRLHGCLEYDANLFEEATVRAMSDHFCVLAGAMTREPDAPIARLPILTDGDRRRLLESWNGAPADYPRARTIRELFEEQARATPEAAALIVSAAAGDETISYEELDRRANRLAHRLQEAGAAPGSRIGVALDRSAEAVVAILAILKAGGAYVPLDPSYPAERLSFLAEDSGTEIIITSPDHEGGLPSRPRRVYSRAASEGSSAPLPPCGSPESTAYLMYTSGSTGEPKAVVVPNRAVVRLVRNANYARFGAGEVFLCAASLAFDASTFEIWGSLLNGGRMVILPDRHPTLSGIAAAIARYGVTTLWLTAGLFHKMVDTQLDALACVPQILAGGDVLSVQHVNRLLSSMRNGGVLVNGYGPTENTTFTCCHVMKAGVRVEGAVPIGRPVSNTTVYVLDNQMQPVPPGVAGELYTGGDGVALGYHRRDALNRERFLRDPFSARRNALLYRTGDLARYRRDGVLEFLGRSDSQVKVRGYRVELGEVEALARQHPDVRDAAVALVRDSDGDASLACYVVPAGGLPSGFANLRAWLAQKAPEYMVPSRFLAIEEIPLTPNGKIDRRRLPEPERVVPGGPAPARNVLEAKLVRIWERALEVSGIGIRDNFFSLGGHSLTAIKLFAELDKLFGALPIALLFEAPTIEQMSSRLAQGAGEWPWRSLVLLQPGSGRPAVFFVPGIRGMALGGLRLAQALGPEQPVYAFQSAGLDGKRAPMERIEDIAEDYLRGLRLVQEHGPYHLVGACMGGAIAYEMTRRLREAGETVQTLALLETWPPDAIQPANTLASSLAVKMMLSGRRLSRAAGKLATMPLAEKWAYLRRGIGATRQLMLDRKACGADLTEFNELAVERANYRAISHYAPPPCRGGVILALATGQRPLAADDPRLRWRSLAGGKCEVHCFDAEDSGALLREPWVHPVARIISESVGNAAGAVSVSGL
jgi:aspartate racemase